MVLDRSVRVDRESLFLAALMIRFVPSLPSPLLKKCLTINNANLPSEHKPLLFVPSLGGRDGVEFSNEH